MRTLKFKKALENHCRRLAKERKRDEEKTVKDRVEATARRLAPFQAAAASLEVLMEKDSDFKKFIIERVVVNKDGFHGIAPMKLGLHKEQDGWVFDITPTYKYVSTRWCIVLTLSKEGKIELKVHRSDQLGLLWSPLDVPEQVCEGFQWALKILQDKKKAYDFLLKEFV